MDGKYQRKHERKYQQVEGLQITEQELGKTIKKRKKLVRTWNRQDIKFLLKNIKINVEKTSSSNAGMNRESKQSIKMANTRKMVLMPKTEDLPSETDYRLITCLNTLYKFFNEILA